ncbi:MAG: YifB family Mg chelatase-like AAA ATPase [Rikenellaceae bacterium]|jgi:magnesium chelatase family protein|nr:YifB family Mg chelatase-like AAA ATPase [Rikenellaceae bacterium]
MFVKAFASTIVGIKAVTITVEVHLTGGIGMYLVGLPDNAVKESGERIRAAFENSGYRMTGRKTTVNLAPADLRKEGSAYDLPIALAILAASGQISDEKLGDYMILGELSLDGSVKAIRGALPSAIQAAAEGFKGIIVPEPNAPEAAVVDGLKVYGVQTLKQVAEFLNGGEELTPAIPDGGEAAALAGRYDEDFSDVRGQAHVKRALEIAAAGGHNVIMIGAPGSGKTMLARRMPTIMPPMTLAEALEVTKIHSVAGKLGRESGLMTRRPFRTPHHLTSQVALIGGGQNPQPGEISLAHNGILYADEFAEFGRGLLEVLRQPLEDRKITVSRARYSVEYPANFILIASMNPCPCGYYNHPTKECTCAPGAVARYMNRISGPLMDRIDMHIQVTPVDFAEMNAAPAAEPSAAVRARVVAARERQQHRFDGLEGVHTNAMMNPKMIRSHARPSADGAALLERAMKRYDLSARAYDRILKVARTIADLAGSAEIESAHIAEAIHYRSLDKAGWGL